MDGDVPYGDFMIMETGILTFVHKQRFGQYFLGFICVCKSSSVHSRSKTLLMMKYIWYWKCLLTQQIHSEFVPCLPSQQICYPLRTAPTSYIVWRIIFPHITYVQVTIFWQEFPITILAVPNTHTYNISNRHDSHLSFLTGLLVVFRGTCTEFEDTSRYSLGQSIGWTVTLQ